MDVKEFNNTRRKISVMGVGTWMLSDDKAANISSLRYAMDNGVNFIDTAEMYGTENVVGEAIRGRNRGGLFIASKVWPTHFEHDSLIKACTASLEKIGTDYLDLYQLHWPNKSVEISETMKAMEELVSEGKIRSIGVSNFSLEELKNAQAAMSKYEIASNQVEYSVVTREIEDEGLFDYCKNSKIAIIAYSPLSHGKLFENHSLISELNAIGSKYGKTPAQLALNWLMQRENTFPIPKASNVVHMKEDIESAGFRLEKNDVEVIEGMYSKYYKPSISKTHRTHGDKLNSYNFKEEKT